MLQVTCKLVGMSPLGFSAPKESEKAKDESHDKFEERTWRERMHTDENDNVFLSPMSIKNCLAECAKFLGEKIKGCGNNTWTKHFEAGIMVPEPLMLGVKGADVPGQRLFLPADGTRSKSGGKRVWKRFPFLVEWSVSPKIVIMDKRLIDEPEKVEEYLIHAGQFIGLGFFRPRNNGYWGRFKVEGFKAKPFSS